MSGPAFNARRPLCPFLSPLLFGPPALPVQTAVRSSEARWRTLLSERISSVASRTSLRSKTIVSEFRSSKLMVMYLSLASRRVSTRWRRFLIRHAVDLLDDLGERVAVPLADPVREHRRGDDHQLLAGEGGLVAPAGRQRAADRSRTSDRHRRPVERREELGRRRREDQRAVDEVRRVSAPERLDQLVVLGRRRAPRSSISLPSRTIVSGDLAVLRQRLDEVLEPEPEVVADLDHARRCRPRGRRSW